MNNSFYTAIWHLIKFVLFVFLQKPFSSVGVTRLLSQELGDVRSPRRLLEGGQVTDPTGGCMSTPGASDKGLAGEPGSGQLTWAREDDVVLS